MTIQMRVVEEDNDKRWCPTVYCQICALPIEVEGCVYYAPEGSLDVHHVHKADCAREFEARLKKHTTVEWYWVELEPWLYNLVANAKIDWQRAGEMSDFGQRM